MIPVRDKKSIPKGKINLVFPIFLKIHLQFQQALPKCYINSHEVCVPFLRKESVWVLSILSNIFSVFSGLSPKRSNYYSRNLVLHDRKWIYGSNLIRSLGTIHIWRPWKLCNFQDPHPPLSIYVQIFPPPLTLDVQFKQTPRSPSPKDYGTTTAPCMWTNEMKTKAKPSHATFKLAFPCSI